MIYSGENFVEADGASMLTIDALSASRPYGSQCDVGAYEFDGVYVFAASNEATL